MAYPPSPVVWRKLASGDIRPLTPFRIRPRSRKSLNRNGRVTSLGMIPHRNAVKPQRVQEHGSSRAQAERFWMLPDPNPRTSELALWEGGLPPRERRKRRECREGWLLPRRDGFSEGNMGPALERHLIENFGSAAIEGSRIRVIGTMVGPGGRAATVQSVWQVTSEGFVDLITAVPR